MSMKLNDLSSVPSEDRPRERFLAGCATNADLLAIQLRTGTKNESVIKVAHNLLQKFGTLENLFHASQEELCELSGIGKVKAIELRANFELTKRMLDEIGNKKDFKILDADNAFDFFKGKFIGKMHEELWVAYLGTKGQVINSNIITQGLADRSLSHAREVFMGAIKAGAVKIIIAHNHPSGDPSPSPQDIEMTKNLSQAGEIIGISLIDHIIIGRGDRFVSLKRQHLF